MAVTPTGGATRTRRPAVITRNELLVQMNDDFDRACRSIYGYAVYAERLKEGGRRRAAAAVERRGQLAVTHALVVCQVVYDFGGMITDPVDELNAVLNADRVAAPGWREETVRRLRERGRQLRAIGEPGLAKRLTRVAAAERSAPDLSALLAARVAR